MVLSVRPSKGFTLIEMMISILLIMVSMLALLTVMVYATTTSLDNEYRDTGTRMLNQTSEALLALSFSDPLVSAGSYTRVSGNTAQDKAGIPDTNQTVRNANRTYSILWTVTPTPSPDTNQITITVQYANKENQSLQNSLGIYKRRPKT